MSLKNLQEKIGATPDGVFGPNTMKLATKYFNLTPFQSAHFFGQVAHETGNFTVFEENLNYSTEGLLKTFKKYFPTYTLAQEYARRPQRIANRVYANRMGNGDEASGDGWRYRGRGAIQLTGKFNYGKFATYSKDQRILLEPGIVATEYAFESALFFFETNYLWKICDQGIHSRVITQLTRRINGGTNGLDDRIQKTLKYYEYVKGGVE